MYVNEGNSFVISNNMGWELCSHDLKCNMCDHKETYIGKTVGDNVVGFKSRINQHIEQVFPLVNFPYTFIMVP